MPESESPTPLKTFLSIFIALAAVSGALISWRAARLGAAAGSADGAAITAALDEASSEMRIASDIFANTTAAREFNVHMENARAINQEYLHNQDVPPHWLDEWQAETIRARARHTQLMTDYLKTREGRVTFESARYHDTARAQEAALKPLDTAPFLKKAAGLRRRAGQLFSLNALFTAAIFLFTVVLKTDVRRKVLWTAAGLILYASGLGLAVRPLFL